VPPNELDVGATVTWGAAGVESDEATVGWLAVAVGWSLAEPRKSTTGATAAPAIGTTSVAGRVTGATVLETGCATEVAGRATGATVCVTG
jgi:hypothetical protein